MRGVVELDSGEYRSHARAGVVSRPGRSGARVSSSALARAVPVRSTRVVAARRSSRAPERRSSRAAAPRNSPAGAVHMRLSVEAVQRAALSPPRRARPPRRRPARPTRPLVRHPRARRSRHPCRHQARRRRRRAARDHTGRCKPRDRRIAQRRAHKDTEGDALRTLRLRGAGRTPHYNVRAASPDHRLAMLGVQPRRGSALIGAGGRPNVMSLRVGPRSSSIFAEPSQHQSN